MSKYSHRNGETDPPTDAGYYFFKGRRIKQRKGYNRAVFMRIWEHEGTLRHYFGSPGTVDELTGQWWGPVSPPWENPDE